MANKKQPSSSARKPRRIASFESSGEIVAFDADRGVEGDWVAWSGLPGLTQEVYVLVRHIRGVPQLVGLKILPERTPIVFFGDDVQQNADLQGGLSSEERWLVEAEESGADVAITAERLRALPLSSLKTIALAEFKENYEQAIAKAETAFRPQREGRRLPDSHFEEVARVYRDAVAVKQPPLKAVGEHFFVSRPGAAKYVKRARELGYLGYPTRPGVAGASEKKSPIKKTRPAKRPTQKRTP